MKKIIALIALSFTLSGCLDYGDTLRESQGVTNVKSVGRGYYEYNIDNGTVKCREHERRAELTCWKENE